MKLLIKTIDKNGLRHGFYSRSYVDKNTRISGHYFHGKQIGYWVVRDFIGNIKTRKYFII